MDFCLLCQNQFKTHSSQIMDDYYRIRLQELIVFFLHQHKHLSDQTYNFYDII